MYELDISDLMKLIYEGRAGADYAWEHRDELIAREHTYTLYGPHATLLGASIPSSLTPAKVRQLKESTRRKNYTIYELDNSCRVLRTIQMINYTKCIDTFHHFEVNGATYAYCFNKYGRPRYHDRILVLKYQNGKPIYYADTTATHIYAEFYEYLELEKLGISCYSMATNATHTQFGYPVDWSAPIGAGNSPVSCHYREETVQYIDFSHWLKEN